MYRYKLILLLTFALGISKPSQSVYGETGIPREFDMGSFLFNAISVDMENNGMLVSYRISGNPGMEWPAGTMKFIDFASGIWFAGLVNGQLRTAVAEYSSEFIPGTYGSDPNDDEFRIYFVTSSDLQDPLISQNVLDWPWMQGAPWIDANGDGIYNVQDGDIPDMHGDFMIWYIMNDSDPNEHINGFGTDPLNIEVSVLQWGYWGSFNTTALNNMLFTKLVVTNKGIEVIEDMYFSVWDDPDIGYAGDDFVGCDTLRNTGFSYNEGGDNYYGPNPPAIGKMLLQGPFVESQGDTAYAFGNVYPDYKNLKMTSFVKYINGDPDYMDPVNANHVYNYMQGLQADGSPFINSSTGLPSVFVAPCNPNDNIDSSDDCWVDSDDHPSGDRRYLLSSGPFQLLPDENQEIIFATVIAQGESALESVSELFDDLTIAQLLYESDFPQIGNPGFNHFTVTGPVILADNLNHDGLWNNGETISLEIGFANFSFYTSTQTISVYSNDPQVHFIDDISLTITLEPLENVLLSDLSMTPLIALDPDFDSPSVEIIISFYEEGSGVVFTEYNIPVQPLGFEPEIIWTDHIQGVSDNQIGYIIVDYSQLQGHEYEVFFAEYDSVFQYVATHEPDEHYMSLRDTLSVLGINIRDITTGEILLEDHPIPDTYGFDMPVIHGFKLHVESIMEGIHGIFMVHDGETSLEENSDLPIANLLQEPVWNNFPDNLPYLENSNGGYYFATQGGGIPANEQSYYNRVFRGSNFSRAIPYDFEMRFTEEGGYCWFAYTTEEPVQVPFELWNIGVSTPDDPSDDYRMICWIWDGNGDNKYGWYGDLEDSPDNDDPGTDWVYWRNPEDTSPGTSGYDEMIESGWEIAQFMGEEVMARTVWNNWNGSGSVLDTIPISYLSDPNPENWTHSDTLIFLDNGWFIDYENSLGQVEVSGDYAIGRIMLFPETGSVFRWITNKIVTVDDRYAFSTEEHIVFGCTDPEANNYDPVATHDDGSCEYFLAGDLNADNELNILDIVILVTIITGDLQPSEYQQLVGDYNVDGTLNILDVVMMINCIMSDCW